MVVRVALRAQQAGADRVVVATDDERIKSRRGGARHRGVPHARRPSDGHRSPGRGGATPRAVRRCDRRQRSGRRAAAFARADPRDGRCFSTRTPTPRSRPHVIRSTDAAEAFNPNVVKVVLDQPQLRALFQPRDDSLGARRVRRRPRPPSRRAADLPPLRALRVSRPISCARIRRFAPAAVERFEALEQLRALWHGFRIVVEVTSGTPAPGVDTPEDLERVRALFASGAV